MPKIVKNMDKDIAEFGVSKVIDGKIYPAPEIKSTKDYVHGFMGISLHHFIKDTHFKRDGEWYEANGIKQELFAIPFIMHIHLEDPIHGMDEETFFKVYKIRKDRLLFNRKKWIAEQVIKEQQLKKERNPCRID